MFFFLKFNIKPQVYVLEAFLGFVFVDVLFRHNEIDYFVADDCAKFTLYRKTEYTN